MLKISRIGLISGINGIQYADVFKVSGNLILLTNDFLPENLNKTGLDQGAFADAKVKFHRDSDF